MRRASRDAASSFSNQSLDFAYIDANHAYAHAADDIALWWPKIKIGGIFAGHDYLDGDLPQGRFGVKRAVNEFIARTGQRLFITPETWPTWYVIKQRT